MTLYHGNSSVAIGRKAKYQPPSVVTSKRIFRPTPLPFWSDTAVKIMLTFVLDGPVTTSFENTQQLLLQQTYADINVTRGLFQRHRAATRVVLKHLSETPGCHKSGAEASFRDTRLPQEWWWSIFQRHRAATRVVLKHLSETPACHKSGAEAYFRDTGLPQGWCWSIFQRHRPATRVVLKHLSETPAWHKGGGEASFRDTGLSQEWFERTNPRNKTLTFYSEHWIWNFS
jgi:hypothetical protein